MRWLHIAVVVVAAVGLGCPRTKSYVGTLTGTVIGPDGQPAIGAVVYLGGGDANAPTTVTPVPLNGGADSGLSYTSAQGRFYLDANAGGYVLVASWYTTASLAAYQNVTIEGGSVTDVGTIQVQDCFVAPQAGQLPCPPPPGPSATPTPSPGNHLGIFQPDTVTVTRFINSAAASDDLVVDASSQAQAEAIHLVIPHAGNGWSASTAPYDLATGGTGGAITVQLTQDFGNGGVYAYTATGGELFLDNYDLVTTGAPNGFTAHLQNVSFALGNDPSYTVILDGSAPLSGPVNTVNQ